MKNIYKLLNNGFGLALSSGDELETKSFQGLKYNAIPLKGSSNAQSFFQRELEVAHREGRWIPKILLLPNVGKFEIKLNGYKPDLLANGILSRSQSNVSLYANRNRKMNRYLIYSYWRLLNSLGTQNYWNITVNLIRNSSALLAVAAHSVDRNMYRELSMHELLRLFERINLMRANFHFRETLWSEGQDPIKAMRHYVKYYRVYIPKGRDSVRPLGVPTRAWRIYQKMWLIPIMGFTGHIIPPAFHGYIPGRGTGTAWREILRTVIHKSNIFEVDFKGFFPSVPTAELTYALFLEGSIPLSVCVYLHYMNNSLPMYLTPDKLPEKHYGEGHEYSLVLDQLKLKLSAPQGKERLLPGISTTGLRDPNAVQVHSSLLQSNRPYGYKAPVGVVQGIKPAELPNTLQTGSMLRKELEPKLPRHVDLEYVPVKFDIQFEMMKWMASRGIPLNRPLTELQREEMWTELKGKTITASEQYSRILLGTLTKFETGLPQGATLSPYLSILYLEIVFKRLGVPAGVDYIFYADDGIFFSDDYKALSSWVWKMSQSRISNTSLAHYNIIVHKEKSSWVKINGAWKHPLKFLGLRFIPGATLATSVLQAATRPNLMKGRIGSTLIFDRSFLVSYEYSVSLLKEGRSSLVLRKEKVKTLAMKRYYSGLIQLLGLSRKVIDYLYLVSAVLSAGVSATLIFFNSKAYELKDSATLKELLEVIELKDSSSEVDAQRKIRVSKLFDGEKDHIFEAVKWLRGGYEGSYYHPSASNSLVTKLERGLSSVGGEGLPIIIPESNVDESLRKFMAAPMFFGWSMSELFKDSEMFIRRAVNDLPSGVQTVPLDLYRFLWTMLMPVFGVLVPPMHEYPTRSDRTNKLEPYYLALAWPSIRKYQKQFQFKNLVNSQYLGLIMSRLYAGNWLPDDVEQSFEFKFKPRSLAEFLQDHDTNNVLNVFVGSSYATHEYVRLLSHLKRSMRTKAPFRLFSEGFLPRDAWNVSAFIELETPSLAREFPGGKEPNWHAS